MDVFNDPLRIVDLRPIDYFEPSKLLEAAQTSWLACDCFRLIATEDIPRIQ